MMSANMFVAGWENSLLEEPATVRDVLTKLNSSSLQIVLIVDNNRKLIGTICDGDIRRGLLAGVSMDDPVSKVVSKNPVGVSPKVSSEQVLALMVEKEILQIPVISEAGSVVGLHVWKSLNVTKKLDNLFVVMAGGKGLRMRPLTENLPKPMLELNGMPMLEHIIVKAKAAGFQNFNLVVNYLHDKIIEYFGDGEKWGVAITYTIEEAALGTAGGLKLISPVPETAFLVTNGDIVSDVNYNDLLDFHEEHKADLTVGVHQVPLRNPFGVVQVDGVDVISIIEKPIVRTVVNAGIYIMSPKILTAENIQGYLDMPSLLNNLVAANLKVIAFPLYEPWMDVGEPTDLQKLTVEV